METTDRETVHPIADFLHTATEKPYAFGFFHLIRMMECLYDNQPRVGESLRAADEMIRLSQEPSMGFETATLTGVKPGGKNKPHRLSVSFFGMLGPNGPLPLHLTEYARQRQLHYNDHTFARFLDIFNHRMLSLFYRAWAVHQPVVSFDRPESDRFITYIGSLSGLGMSAFLKRDEFPDYAKLHYTGRLSCYTKNPDGLMAMLSDYFKLPADIEEFIGEWLPLPKEMICRLGMGAATTLGRSLIVGRSMWACQHKFRIRMGPMGFSDYVRFLPTGDRINALVALVRNYIGDELAWDMNLVLKEENVPALRLDGSCQLGWTTWLGARPSRKDADDLILTRMGC